MQTDSSLADMPSATPMPRQLSWDRASVVILIIIAVGVGINIWHPLLLAPPYLELSPIFYQICSLVWALAMIFYLLRRPTGRRRIPVLLAIVGVLSTCVALAFSQATMPVASVPPYGSPLECTTVSQTAERVRYECVANRMFMSDTYTLEGPAGWPVVWLVSTKSVNY